MVARKAPRCGCGARPREAQRFAGAGIPGPGITPHCRRACQYRHERAETNDMTGKFKIGDHVGWNSEAGRVSGTIIKVHTRDFDYKGHTHRPSAEEPQYEIRSDQTRSEEHPSEIPSIMRIS